mmetsp:Transcript_19628/g.47376  ORF Transcript_19628/g.47376 Transcript_19628/m.47376 type:complete len:907 (-) Transcript_19628:1222-3942(-)
MSPQSPPNNTHRGDEANRSPTLQDQQMSLFRPPIGVIVVSKGQQMGPLGDRDSTNGSAISISNSFGDGEDASAARGQSTMMTGMLGDNHEMVQAQPLGGLIAPPSSSFMDSVAMPAPPARRPHIQWPSVLPASLQQVPAQHQPQPQAHAPSIGGAGFRLQPRGKATATTPSTVNSGSATIGSSSSAPSSVDSTRGRKRGASCMGSKPSLIGSVSNRTNNSAATLTQRTLFPIHPTDSTKSSSPELATTVKGRNRARSMIDSPSRIQSAIQSLSIKSPKTSFEDSPSTSSSIPAANCSLSTIRDRNSMHTEQRSTMTIGYPTAEKNTSSSSASPSSFLPSLSPMKMKSSPSSPFYKVSSAFQSSPSPIQSFMARSRGGDSRRTALDQSLSSTCNGVSPFSLQKQTPKLAPVYVLQGPNTPSTKMGTPQSTASSPRECSSSLLAKSLSSDRSITDGIARTAVMDEDRITRTPSSKYEHHQHSSSPFTGTPQSRVLHTERAHVSTPASLLQTPQSRRTVPSPYSTPLPRTRLTPRRTPGSNDISMLMSPRDLDLDLNQTRTNDSNSLMFGSGRPRPSRSPTSRSNENKLNHPWSTMLEEGSSPSRQQPPASTRHVLPSIESVFARQPSTTGDSADSHLKSLLGRSVTLPSSPHANLSSAVGAGAINCDDSLTDDEDEPFVLADPAVIAQERHVESQPAPDRPTRRRRMSVETENEMSTVGDRVDRLTNDGNEDMNISHRASTQAVALSTSQPSVAPHGSTTSLLGMAFLRGDSYGDFASGSNAVDGPIARTNDGRQALRDESTNFLSRQSSSGSLLSVGLDLDYPSTIEKNPTRDVHTPLAQMESSAPASSPPINRLNKSYSSPADAPSMASTMFYSQSDPTSVRMAIERAMMSGELTNQCPPVTTCST